MIFSVTFFNLQIFFLGGRFVFGPDVRSVFLSIFLITAPVVAFCVFVARKLLDEFDHHLGVLVMAAVIVFTIYVSLFTCYCFYHSVCLTWIC